MPNADSWSNGTMEMDGGGMVRERGGAESGSTCTVVTGTVVAALLRSKVTDLAVEREAGMAVTITGSAGQKTGWALKEHHRPNYLSTLYLL